MLFLSAPFHRGRTWIWNKSTVIRIVATAIVIATCGQGAFAQIGTVAPKWTSFHSDFCRFTASFPGVPHEGLPSGIPSPDVDNELQSKMYTASTNRATYMVMCLVFSPPLRPNGMRFLEISRDNAVKAVHGTLLSDRPTTVQGYPARDFSLRGTYQQYTDTAYDRTVVVGEYYYMLAVTSQDDVVTIDVGKEVDSFFASFSITKK
jgi:hypothetical protein